MKKLLKLLKLQRRDRDLLFITFVLLNFFRLGLWLLPLTTLQKVLNRLSSRKLVNQPEQQISISKITWAVNLISFYTPRGVKCFARALTTQVLMKWYGYFPELHIGVKKEKQGQFEAHAWVEEQGLVVIGNLADLDRFIPLLSLNR